MTLLAFAAERSATARCRSIISRLPGPQQQTRRTPLGQTDGRKDRHRIVTQMRAVKKRHHRFHRTAENVGTYKHYFIKDKILTSLYN